MHKVRAYHDGLLELLRELGGYPLLPLVDDLVLVLVKLCQAFRVHVS